MFVAESDVTVSDVTVRGQGTLILVYKIDS